MPTSLHKMLGIEHKNQQKVGRMKKFCSKKAKKGNFLLHYVTLAYIFAIEKLLCIVFYF